VKHGRKAPRVPAGSDWRKPTGFVRATEIAQVTALDAPSDGSALRRAEAFPLQAVIEFAVVACVEAFLGCECLQASKDPVLLFPFLHKRGPVADERRARWIEVALQARDPRASLPIDEGA